MRKDCRLRKKGREDKPKSNNSKKNWYMLVLLEMLDEHVMKFFGEKRQLKLLNVAWWWLISNCYKLISNTLVEEIIIVSAKSKSSTI